MRLTFSQEAFGDNPQLWLYLDSVHASIHCIKTALQNSQVSPPGSVE